MSLSVMLRHRFADSELDIAFEAPSRGITALFGRSGAGKSTVLAAVAGLFRPDSCRVALDGAVVADSAAGLFVPPEHRRVGVVFQDSRLFPHMSVLGNLRYGLRRAPEGKIGFDEVVELLGIGGLLARRPHTLSGGERQRVAIGRALLAQPRLLLMDEPLASLDDERRAEILPYLARLHRQMHLPTLYVTHALDELLRLADHVVLLRGGRVLAAGPVDALAARADLPLARREDAASVLEARVIGAERYLTAVSAGGARLLVRPVAAAAGSALRLRIPAREVILARPEAAGLAAQSSVQNVLTGHIRALVEDASREAVLAEVSLGGEAVLLARVTRDAVARLGLAPGAAVLALVKSVAIEPLE
jgi:molybdate transport system ATP-binding protein